MSKPLSNETKETCISAMQSDLVQTDTVKRCIGEFGSGRELVEYDLSNVRRVYDSQDKNVPKCFVCNT
jgi:hypothetical protein